MDVYALVGASGSGKSHRALLVARHRGIRHIIDDGLLISWDGRILAGRSAKREATGPAAVRRAIFEDRGHATAVRAALAKENPDCLLVLGTSHRMVERISEALSLPQIRDFIDIEDVSSPTEIRRAHNVRRLMGKHVIPAPTLEVKKSFSGYLVDSLRLLSRGRYRPGDQQVIEKSVVRPTFSSLGRFYIADRVVVAIVEYACLEVEGVLSVAHVMVDLREEGVVLDVALALHYGLDLVKVLHKAQDRCRSVVEHMTALNVLAVDVTAQRLAMTESHTTAEEAAK